MFRPLVYVASPYSTGDPCINTNFQLRIFDRLMDEGYVWPYVPLWSHFQHTAFPRPYEDWIEYDKVIIPKCQALLRLSAVGPGGYLVCESRGADGEVALADSLDIPVFYDISDMNRWVRQNRGELVE